MKRRIRLTVGTIAAACVAVVACREGTWQHRMSRRDGVPERLPPGDMSTGHDYYADNPHFERLLRGTVHDSQESVDKENAACLTCHTGIDSATMHPQDDDLRISCVDCHGGEPNPQPRWTGEPIEFDNPARFDSQYVAAKQAAHKVKPRFPDAWADPETGLYSAANPVRSYTLLNYENPEFIRFVNPGDLRVAHVSCGKCHMDIVQRVRNSMMTHGAQLWAAALYNNGSYPHKLARFGESYSVKGVPQRLYSIKHDPDRGYAVRHQPTPDEEVRGVIARLDPLPRWEVAQMGNILRAFERGGKIQRLELEVGLPNIFEEPGKPDMKLSDRGLGTQLATDPVFLGIQKTRLLDPILPFLGTNDHPGDYRSSGCTACHAVYANDRAVAHSARFARAGHLGQSQTNDPTIARGESGHPIQHVMTEGIPSSQCVVCHIHPGTSFANTYLGFTWWDNETHADLMYPAEQRDPTAEQYLLALMANPEGANVRGLWSDLWPEQTDHHGRRAGKGFLERIWNTVNAWADRTQFADFHGHGWVFRAVFDRDRLRGLPWNRARAFQV